MSSPSTVRSNLAAQVAQQYQQRTSSTTDIVSESTPAPAATIGPRAVAPADELRQWAALTQSGITGLRNSMLTIAYYGYKVVEAGNWTALGIPAVDSEDSWRDHLGLSAKLWREHMTLGARISHLPVEQLGTLTIGTAQQLALIHPRIWTEYAWLDEARLLKTKEFAALVAERNVALQTTAFASQVVEPKGKLTVQMADSQRRDLDRRLTRLRRVHSRRSQADTLEFVIEQAEQAELLQTRQHEIEGLVRELESVWLDIELRETEEEKTARLAAGPDPRTRSLLSAAQRTCSLLSKLNRCFTKGAVDAIEANGPSSASDPA